jgi:tetratricopeptide (TPR) repeat protein
MTPVVRASFVTLSVSFIFVCAPHRAFSQADVDWKSCKSEIDLPEVRVETDCTQLIELKKLGAGDLAQAYHRRAIVYWRQGEPDRVIADENTAIKLDEKFADAYLRRGTGYLDRRDYKNAAADFTKAINLDPNNAIAYSDRSIVRARERDATGALSDATKAVAIDPNFLPAHMILASRKAAFTVLEFGRGHSNGRVILSMPSRT